MNRDEIVNIAVKENIFTHLLYTNKKKETLHLIINFINFKSYLYNKTVLVL